MSAYFFERIIEGSFDDVEQRITSALKEQGFGILTEINVQGVFKNKLDIDFRPYKILGACNPNFAHQAISAEPNIGVFLPCSVVIQGLDNGRIKIAAVDPVASMMSVENAKLGELAGAVQTRIKKAVEAA
ncbi:MAG: DUF302 domain-containing protein [Bacteroidota bacterium]|nr:DUF302 domain-containing protein [Bacteroidota bacterium]